MDVQIELTNRIKKLYDEYNKMTLIEQTKSIRGINIQYEINMLIKELKDNDKNAEQEFKGSIHGHYKSDLIKALRVSLNNLIDKQLNLMKKQLDKFIKQELNKN